MSTMMAANFQSHAALEIGQPVFNRLRGDWLELVGQDRLNRQPAFVEQTVDFVPGGA
jgi:hypothetical protein